MVWIGGFWRCAGRECWFWRECFRNQESTYNPNHQFGVVKAASKGLGTNKFAFWDIDGGAGQAGDFFQLEAGCHNLRHPGVCFLLESHEAGFKCNQKDTSTSRFEKPGVSIGRYDSKACRMRPGGARRRLGFEFERDKRKWSSIMQHVGVVPHGCGSKPMVSHFGVGAPPTLVYFGGEWDVHWGYGLLTHGHICLFEDWSLTNRFDSRIASFASVGACQP